MLCLCMVVIAGYVLGAPLSAVYFQLPAMHVHFLHSSMPFCLHYSYFFDMKFDVCVRVLVRTSCVCGALVLAHIQTGTRPVFFRRASSLRTDARVEAESRMRAHFVPNLPLRRPHLFAYPRYYASLARRRP